MSYLVDKKIEAYLHNEQYGLVLRELIDRIVILEEQVKDLTWRIENKVPYPDNFVDGLSFKAALDE